MKTTIDKVVVLNALMMKVKRSKPKQKMIVHSDQGSQYGSDECKRFCDGNKMVPKMTRSGNCWENAVAESIFSYLKKIISESVFIKLEI